MKQLKDMFNIPSSVLSESCIIIIDKTSLGAEDNVLKDGTESDSIEDIGFLFSGEANALSVTL